MSSPARPVLTGLWAAAAASLSACTTLGPNFRSPAPPAQPGYAMAGDAAPAGVILAPGAAPAGPWWRALGSAQLDHVMNEALAGNHTLAEADATLARAHAETQSARGGLYPSVDANATAERQRINFKAFGFPGFNNPTINLFSVGGTVSYDLDLFGGQKRRVEAVAAIEEDRARRAEAAYLTLTGNVGLWAVDIAGLRARIATVQAIIDDDRRNLDIVRAAEAAGGEAHSAGIGAKAQLAEDEALAPPLNQQLAQARHALAVLVGRAPSEWTAPDFDLAAFSPPASVPAVVPSLLVRRRPDILAAEAELHAATARIGVATANLYPDIRLVAGLTQAALTPQTLFSYDSSGWNIGASLAAPIFHGGTLRADKRAAEADARVALARYQQTVLEAFLQVSDVMAGLAHDDERIAALQRASDAAEAALHDNRAAYQLGGGAYLPLILAQRQLDRARLDLVQARAERLADLVKLFAATAADWRTTASGRS